MTAMLTRRALERALGRRHRGGTARIDRDRLAQRARQTLEARFDDVMVVLAVQILDMQRDAGLLRERLEPLLEQLGVHGAELGLREPDLPDQVGPVRDVE